jgi:membrane-associated protease RseP (regulator of RpoE activity)
VDESLDYLVVPPRSAVWAQIVSARASEEAVLIKLHVHKIRLNGGHAYPVSARLTDVSGDHVLTRVSPGGTLVTAARPQGKKRPSLLPPETRYKIELLEPLVMYEGPSFYRSGVGLWFKARAPRPGENVFEVTHVIPKRSAALAGLEPGDHVTYVAGVSAGRLDFPAAIERLYGPAGTDVDVRVRRKGVGREENLSLRRGATHRQDLGFETRPVEGGLQVTQVAEDSPAERAGLKAGDAIVQFGSLPVNELPDKKVREFLAGDLVEENELLVRRGAAPPFRASVRRGWVRVALPPPYKP